MSDRGKSASTTPPIMLIAKEHAGYITKQPAMKPPNEAKPKAIRSSKTKHVLRIVNRLFEMSIAVMKVAGASHKNTKIPAYKWTAQPRKQQPAPR